MKKYSEATFLEIAALKLCCAYHQNPTINFKDAQDFVNMAVEEAILLNKKIKEVENGLLQLRGISEENL